MNIRPVSDLRNQYSDVERKVQEKGSVFLARNGYGSMAAMSIEQFDRISGTVEAALDAADRQAASIPARYAHDEVFGSIRAGLRERT